MGKWKAPWLARSIALVLMVVSLVGCSQVGTGGTTAPAEEEATAEATPETEKVTMTDVGTPRYQTLVVQNFDRKTDNPDQHNPLMNYAIWRGFRELGWGYLWEMNTATGESYPELADGPAEPLNDEHTKFRVKLKQGIYWSDGVEFTADDVIYTLDTYFQDQDKLTYWGVHRIVNYVKDYKKIDDYTIEVETLEPAYDFQTVLGVYTWGSAFNIVPKHIFEKQEDVSQFRNTYPVTLGPYTVKEFDPNGFWQLWERRDDWERSAWGWMGEPKPKYVLYKDFGPEETRSMAFVQNQYDEDTFMSPEGIKAAQSRNEYIETFSDKLPYHNMDDACSYGILMNLQRPPLDKKEVRWALALMLNLEDVGINALSGELKVSPLPMVDQQILHPIYFEPLVPWLREFTLDDGYKPFNEDFAAALADRLQSEVGVPASEIPEGEEALTEAFGIGWWKHDPDEAEKLLNSVGIEKNADGVYTLPDGSVWELELVIPGDWNKVMQRVGFSIADSWRKAGLTVNARQVDNAEFGTVANTNALLQTELNWTNCIFSPNYLNAWQSVRQEYLLPADSNELINGNAYRWSNPTVEQLLDDAITREQDSEQFYEDGRLILKEFVKDMAYINIMNIPTTIPTNGYYWTNYPKQDNYYAVPYTWWSSFKMTLLNVEPTGNR